MTLRTVYMAVGYYFTLVMFAWAGLLLSIFALFCWNLPATDQTERFFQRLIHRCFRLFVWWLQFSRLMRIRYHGLERLSTNNRGLVLVANHPALIDITVLLARVPEAVCIFKPEIQTNPVLGAAARRSGYLTNDGGHDTIRRASQKVAEGHTLVVFPEGTRTPVGGAILPFKPGHVLIARRANVPLQLVRIACNHPVLGKDRAWWKLPPLHPEVDVTIGPLLKVHTSADLAAATGEIERWFRSCPAAADGQIWSPALRLSRTLPFAS